MHIPQEKHIEFYAQQIKAHEDAWREYAGCAMNILIQEKRLFFGKIWGIQEKSGHVILRFNEGEAPRMKQPYFLGMVGSDAPGDPMAWHFSYFTFRDSIPPEPRYYNGIHSDISTQVFWKTEGGKSFILVTGFDTTALATIKERYLEKNIHPMIVIAETDPPIEYLKTLKAFVEKNAEDSILRMNASVTEDNWSPKNLDNKENITNDIIQLIQKQKITLIQGPPGTGKSYLAAEVCNYYLNQGNSVCLTALTNKALMEVATKEGLREALIKGHLYKTNLSNDESRELPKINSVETFTPKQGDLLLSTYYKLAQKQAELIANAERYDILIIEEASQAYLATISMFSSLAKRVLIIGDHKQLTPIVIRQEAAKSIFPKIEAAINGMQTFAFNSNDISFRLTKTRRLTSDAVGLTGLYYNHALESISSLEGRTHFESNYSSLFHPNGGVTIATLPSSRTGFQEHELLRFMCSISIEIRSANPELEIAMLAPYVSAERDLYTQYSKMTHDYKNVTINTVHKIQGLTCDLTIVYLPLSLPNFDLNQNLFNVATSRAKRGTLIITYEHVHLLNATTPETIQFIMQAINIKPKFINLFNNYLAEQ